MIRVGLLLERLTGRKRQMMELFALTVGIVFLAYFTKNAIHSPMIPIASTTCPRA